MSPDDTGRSGRSREFRDQDGRTLPERIRQRRRAGGLKSLELARALGVSPAYVTMIERGKKVPSEDVAVAIAEILGDEPELYRAWVHSTRFTDPTSTLRGLQRLVYRDPRGTVRPPANARMQPASQRAQRRRQAPTPADPGPDVDLAAARFSAPPVGAYRFRRSVASIPGGPEPALEIPLIALGRTSRHQVSFWRLPWAILDNDPRPRRFVVAPSGRRDRLLVATPRQFADIVMNDGGSNLMESVAWRGWQRREPDRSGGSCAQPLDLDGRFAPLLRDRDEFLAALGDPVDVVVREGDGVAVRRLSLAELATLLDPSPL